MEILAKLGSAMSGFWWALDDHERKLLILGGAYMVGMVIYLSTAEQRRRDQIDELADRIAERLQHG